MMYSNITRIQSLGEFNRTASLQSLEELGIENLSASEQSSIFQLLVDEEPSLAFEYTALRRLMMIFFSQDNRINHNILRNLVEKKDLLGLLQEARDVANLLSQQYYFHINEHFRFLTKQKLKIHIEFYDRAIKNLSESHDSLPQINKNTSRKKDIKILKEYKQALDSSRFFKKSPISNTPTPKLAEAQRPGFFSWLWEWIKREWTTENINPWRLHFLRDRRLLLLLIPIIGSFGHYQNILLWLDFFIAPVLVYLNLVFFMPRLIYNLTILFSNTFDHSNMECKSKHLDTGTRFMAQWNRLWPQIVNDIGWSMSGALMCFVFVGGLQPMAIYLSIAMQLFDVAVVGIRVLLDLNRFDRLLKQYEELDVHDASNLQVKYLNKLYKIQMQKTMQRDRALLYLALINASVLFFAVCLSLPFFVAISPFIPVVGAVMAVIMTFINFGTRSWLNAPIPDTLDNLLATQFPDPIKRSKSMEYLSEVDVLLSNSDKDPLPKIKRPILARASTVGDAPHLFNQIIEEEDDDVEDVMMEPLEEPMSMDDSYVHYRAKGY